MDAYIELLPNTPDYKKVLYDSLVKRDVSALRSIKDNFGQPIHLVKNWFYYEMVTRENKGHVIVIYNPEAAEQLQVFLDTQTRDV